MRGVTQRQLTDVRGDDDAPMSEFSRRESRRVSEKVAMYDKLADWREQNQARHG
jgi:hypothetical protein